MDEWLQRYLSGYRFQFLRRRPRSLGIWFSDKAENKHGYESELTAYGADLVGEAPLSESFSVIVSIGLAKYTFKITQPNGWKYEPTLRPAIRYRLQ